MATKYRVFGTDITKVEIERETEKKIKIAGHNTMVLKSTVWEKYFDTLQEAIDLAKVNSERQIVEAARRMQHARDNKENMLKQIEFLSKG